MALFPDQNIENFISVSFSIIARADEQYKNILKDAYVMRDVALAKLKSLKVSGRTSNNLDRKRKLQGISEEVAEVIITKKLRPSNENEEKHIQIHIQDATFALGNPQHSTPNKDVEGIISSPPNQSNVCLEDTSLIGQKSRSKRNASVLAAAMNNKLLNEKLTQKMRRPTSRELNKQDILLDQMPFTVLSNTLKNNNKQQELSVHLKRITGKNGIIMEMENEEVIVDIDMNNENKENQPNLPKSNVENANITITKGTRNKKNISANENAEAPSPHTTRTTRSRVTNNSLVDQAKSVDVSGVNDAAIMPPPVMPVKHKKKSPKRRGRSKKNNESSVVESDPDTTVSKDNSSSRNESSVNAADDSMRPVTRSTRSKAIPIETPPVDVEKPKRARTKRGRTQKDTVDGDQESTQPKTADLSSDEEFEQKKVKLRPKRTKKGRQTTPPVDDVESITLSQDTTLEKCPSKDCDVVPISKLEQVINKKPIEQVTEKKTPRGTRNSTNISESAVTTNSKVVEKKILQDKTINDSPASSPRRSHTQKDTKGQKVLNETVVLDKVSNRETVVLSQSPNKKNLPQVEEQPRQVLNETITLPPKEGKPVPLNETVVIQKSDLIQIDPETSLLTDDLSEVEDTPIKSMLPKFVAQGIKKIKETFMESPVKSRVQHFERLAEAASSPAKAASNIDVPTRVTRTKTRALNKQESDSQEDIPKEVTPVEVPPKTKKVSRSKIATSISGKTVAILNLPLPVSSSKQKGSSVKLGAGAATQVNSVSPSDSLMSPKPMSVVLSKDDALRKKDALLHARSEDQRRKREEKSRNARLARQEQDKLKQKQIEKSDKEKTERLKQLQMEREKLKEEEGEKKRLATERKIQEAEERRKAEDMARKARLLEQEEEARKQAALRQKQQQENEKYLQETKSQAAAAAAKATGSKNTGNSNHLRYKTFDELGTDDESESETSVQRRIPIWTEKSHRARAIKTQFRLKSMVIDTLYSTTVFNPNLQEIFPQIDRRKLVRTSSAVWKTPPRFSMMPKDYQ